MGSSHFVVKYSMKRHSGNKTSDYVGASTDVGSGPSCESGLTSETAGWVGEEIDRGVTVRLVGPLDLCASVTLDVVAE